MTTNIEEKHPPENMAATLESRFPTFDFKKVSIVGNILLLSLYRIFVLRQECPINTLRRKNFYNIKEKPAIQQFKQHR